MQGKAESRHEAQMEIAQNQFAMGMDDAFVSQTTGLDRETVERTKNDLCA